MKFRSLEDAILFLESKGELLRIKEETDPYLEMAAIHLEEYSRGGKAILFERVKGSKFRAVSNLFGSSERSKLLFGSRFHLMSELASGVKNPAALLGKPMRWPAYLSAALDAKPKILPGGAIASRFREIKLSELPQIVHWPMDGGAFVTLPQVYTEDPDVQGWRGSNVGMYRIQISGNDYRKDAEAGLHYQLHRGIGVHQTKWNLRKQSMKVSVFIGGPPSHSFASVMPLPEGLPEISFAGVLGSRRFRMAYDRAGYAVSLDADFIICGEVPINALKPEGPFGDHLGYYSLKHLFPYMNIHKVYAKPAGIWAFTVVGRPPQEDTSFGNLIHEMTGHALTAEIPGLKEIHAVDAAGVHPLLLAKGSERYTPYAEEERPAELLTIANHILGTGQLSLAKFLFITDEGPSCEDIAAYFVHLCERIDLSRDIHFYSETTIDTLDYSGGKLNAGSKVVFAARGKNARRNLDKEFTLSNYETACVLPGIFAVRMPKWTSEEEAAESRRLLKNDIASGSHEGVVFLILTEDADFVAATLNNFLWVSFTRINPTHDIDGVKDFIRHKHWGCEGPLLLDARVKPHHAPPLLADTEVNVRAKSILLKAKE
jgi:4-hydroxy-3-polyprenylbenzoate decarboxylase